MPLARLDDRAVLHVAGEAAHGFLDGLITSDVDNAQPGKPIFAALLTPQGKILFDFFLHVAPEAEGGFYLDCRSDMLPELAKRLKFYRLRAKVTLDARPDDLAIIAGWDDATVPKTALAAGPDPRLAALGWRAIATAGDAPAGDASGDDYKAHRMAHGMPEGGSDYAFGETFPHEALMDHNGGVDFTKGCYVGQEVVSRMQHRGTARTRFVPVTALAGALPEPGVEITAGGKVVGTCVSTTQDRAMAKLRLDRVADALESGIALESGQARLALIQPDWLGISLPRAASGLDSER
ncbi:folate-binding protein [Saliniramus sp.]|uniref:CAF17-like 4Fe-4S cluster assembly/insertion protein YgfZ n=1 Tax=Saliniramus sp. TaxID=2986772 RepID=UPI002BA6EE59|nr:folate-binding protein [Saliniramus sp.]HMB10008.1 folate-binding protein [Saliniramus sp.]